VTRPLFVHYILGQYFTNSNNGSVQLQWLLGEETLMGLSTSGAAAKSIVEFNDQVPIQGCQMAYFLTKNHNLGKFWRVLQ
jgi:L-serine deaminase